MKAAPLAKAAPLVGALCLLAATATAQQPVVTNARLVPRAAGPNLQETVSGIAKGQTEPAWLGYMVPVMPEREPGDNRDGWSERCRLEQGTAAETGAGLRGPIRLEASSTVLVLYRLQDREVQRVRTISSDCQIDAGGLSLFWLDAVSGEQSVGFLRTLVSNEVRGRSESALAAIAVHKDPAASKALIDLAKNGGSTRLRERALFWTARRAESQAAGVIGDAIRSDPDVEVRKRAVFALTQLPGNQGVPLLIDLVKTNTNPAVRKQAIFWLGQSRDPRALTFFEEILR